MNGTATRGSRPGKKRRCKETVIANCKSQIENRLAESVALLATEWAEAKVPYRHRGTTRRGCDCTGLVIGIVQELGFIADYVVREYPADWNLHAGAGQYVIEELDKVADRISKDQAGPGDVPVMNFGNCPAHCGIIVEPFLMVHCYRDGLHCKLAVLRKSPWSKRWTHTFRFNYEKLSG